MIVLAAKGIRYKKDRSLHTVIISYEIAASGRAAKIGGSCLHMSEGGTTLALPQIRRTQQGTG